MKSKAFYRVLKHNKSGLFSQTEIIVKFKNHQMKKYSLLLFSLLLVFSIDSWSKISNTSSEEFNCVWIESVRYQRILFYGIDNDFL